MLAIVSLLAVVLTVVLGVVGASMAFRTARDTAKVLPYESGSLPQQHAFSRYHVRWYAITLLFLAFDMEMIFMYPWTVVVADIGVSSVIEMFAFLTVLFIGVVYVWREGALRWT